MNHNNKYSNHELAITEIAEKLGIPRAQVNDVITTLMPRLTKLIRFPNIIVLPYLGRLVPDMRKYRHILKRRQTITKIKQKFKL